MDTPPDVYLEHCTVESRNYANGLMNRVMDSVTLLQDENPQEWWCNSGNDIIIVRYQDGQLAAGVSESEHEALDGKEVIGRCRATMRAAYNSKPFHNTISFDLIKEFMNWTHDDDICCDGL